MKKFLGLLCLPVCLWADPQTVVILPFENATGQAQYDALKSGLPELLTAFLAPYSDRIHVLEREKLDALMAEHAMRWENFIKEGKSISRLGKMTQAQFILIGSFSGDDHSRILSAQLYDTQTTKLVGSAQAMGEFKDLNRMGDELVAQLFKNTIIPVRHDTLSVDPDPQRNLQLIYGLGYYNHAQFTQAIPEFMKMLSRNANDADARYWLVQSYVGAGLHDHAAMEANTFRKQFPKDPRVEELP